MIERQSIPVRLGCAMTPAVLHGPVACQPLLRRGAAGSSLLWKHRLLRRRPRRRPHARPGAQIHVQNTTARSPARGQTLGLDGLIGDDQRSSLRGGLSKRGLAALTQALAGPPRNPRRECVIALKLLRRTVRRQLMVERVGLVGMGDTSGRVVAASLERFFSAAKAAYIYSEKY